MEAIQRYQNDVEWAAALRHPLHAHSRCDMLLIGGIGIDSSDPMIGLRSNALHMLLTAWPCERRPEGVDNEE